jgi:hypothetical protein
MAKSWKTQINVTNYLNRTLFNIQPFWWYSRPLFETRELGVMQKTFKNHFLPSDNELSVDMHKVENCLYIACTFDALLIASECFQKCGFQVKIL